MAAAQREEMRLQLLSQRALAPRAAGVKTPGSDGSKDSCPYPKGVKEVLTAEKNAAFQSPKADEESSLPGLEGLLQASRV